MDIFLINLGLTPVPATPKMKDIVTHPSKSVAVRINNDLVLITQFMEGKSFVSSADIAHHFGWPKHRVYDRLKILHSCGKIEKIGTSGDVRWRNQLARSRP